MKDRKINNQTSKKSIVSIIQCSNYNQDQVFRTLEQSLQNIDSFDRFIRSNTRVLIKPNLLSAKTPEKAVTTHPAIVKAVVDILQELGAKVIIGDSPAGIFRSIEEYWDATGMIEVAQQTGAKLIAFEKKGVIERVIKGKSYFITKSISEVDVIINLCKMKTHSLTLLTGAIKNMFGVVPGVRKGEFHKKAPKVKDFSELLVDIFEAVKPQINIMDAIIAMEGNGPSSGKPKQVGLIISSTDAVALDSVVAYIMGFHHSEILTTQIAFNRGLGQNDLEKIEFCGVKKRDLKRQDFQLPSNRYIQFIPEFLMKLVGQLIWIHPKAIIEKCKRCGLCIQNCPVTAITSNNGVPVIDYKKCIQCFCCDEICPYNAMEQQMSWLAKKLG